MPAAGQMCIRDSAGLILRVRQGIGAPNRIYVLVPKKRD